MVRGCATVTAARKGVGVGGIGNGRRMAPRRWRRRLALATALLGALVALIGGALALCAPLLFRTILASELTIRPGSTSFNLWKETPVPISLEFYFFNWTNPEELRDPDRRPALVEMGPYIFREQHEKQEIVWNRNATVSFRQVRRWYFDAQASNGSLDDLVTTLNVIPLRNGSDEYDGLFTMHTGADDLRLLGRLSRWNGADRTPFFPGPCGLVNGSAGELWPPARSRHEPIAMFSPDLCRSIELPFSEEAIVHGVPGLRFAGGRRLLSNATEFGPNACFSGGESTPSGVLNVSTCRFGAPAFVSYPHFLQADDSYLRAVKGLHPDAHKHTFFITLEPDTGIPLDVAARFQINILLQPHEGISLFKDVPRIFFPMMWFEERAAITPAMARDLRMLLWLRSDMVTVAVAVASVGTAFAMFAILVLAYWRCTTPSRWEQCHFESAVDGAAMPLNAVAATGRSHAKMAPSLESETPLEVLA